MLRDPSRVVQRNATSSLLSFETLEDRRLLSADAAVDAINQFAREVYEHMQREGGNLLYSPLSISTGLAMTSLGAGGQTLAEMQQVLNLGADPAIHNSFRDLLDSIRTRSANGPNFEFTVANAVWPDDDLPTKQTFIDAVRNLYVGHAQGVDYADPMAAEATINAWVAGRTAGKINDLVGDLSPSTAMVLTNAVYFNALWDIQFKPSETFPRAFELSDGSTITVTTMYGQPEAARTQINGFDVLELRFAEFNYPNFPPFVVGPKYPTASMILAMPLDDSTPNVLTDETLVAIDQWLDSSPTRTRVQVLLPRFEVTVETQLNTFLAELGMPTAFDPGAADFSGISAMPGLYVDQVLHKASIKVNEQGVEATAATAVEILLCFAAGTPVQTPDGARSIEQLRVGDMVLARDEHNLEANPEPKVIEETRQGLAPVLELTVAGRVICVTDLHPFFVRGRGWTPAGELRPGDKLYTSGVDWVEVERVAPTTKAVPVFNLRVADHHTYFVGGDDWEFAVWTHNFYNEGFFADQPFHFVIYDNATDAIAFMGRIDDPRQTENTVSPTVESTATIPGDYNRDGMVDSYDYEVWRSSYGMTGVGLAADGNLDGVVDAADYSIYRDNQGAIAPAVSLPTSAIDNALFGASTIEEDLEPLSQYFAAQPAASVEASPSVPKASRPVVRGPMREASLLALAGAIAAPSAAVGGAQGPSDSLSADGSEAVDRGFEFWGVGPSPKVGGELRASGETL